MRGRPNIGVTVGLALVLAIGAHAVAAQERPGASKTEAVPSELPHLPTISDRAGDPGRAPGPETIPPPRRPTSRAARAPDRPRAVASYEGAPLPGRRITLRAAGSTGARLQYRWFQVQGLPVELEGPTGPAAEFEVPDGSGTLGFLLVVGNDQGVDSARVAIPIQEDGASRTSDPAEAPSADAGDDQVGLVGHLITLNGMRSRPRSRLAYRWMHVSGPPIESWKQDGYTFSFIPAAPGHYRFALVVAAGGAISQPDVVDVFIGTSVPSAASAPASAPLATAATAPRDPATSAAPAPAAAALSDDVLASRALASIEGGPAQAGALAAAFEELADRMSLYTSYVELYSEMSRRLEAIVPADPSRRSAWVERLFSPLTSRMVDRLRAEGLDLLGRGGQAATLTAAQKASLADLFDSVALGFRTTSPRP